MRFSQNAACLQSDLPKSRGTCPIQEIWGHKLFEKIREDLDIVEWEKKGRVKKAIENKIVQLLQEKLDRSSARQKAKRLLDLLKKNKDA